MTLETPLEAHTLSPVTAKKIRSQSRGIVVGVCMAFLLLLSNVAVTVTLLNQQSNYHAASIAKQNEIISLQNEHANTLNQIRRLATDIDNLVALEPAVKTALTNGQNVLIADLAALCSATGARC